VTIGIDTYPETVDPTIITASRRRQPGDSRTKQFRKRIWEKNMNHEDLMLLFDYSQWASDKLFEAAAKLPPEKFTAPHRTTYGSLRGILVHILVSHQVWLSRCRDGHMPAELPSHEDFPDVAAFAQRFQAIQAEVRRYLDNLAEQDLNRRVRYTTAKGIPYENTLWHIFTHLFNHATQHRSEAAEVLTEYGCSPGDLDLIWYLRQLET
jgi:uncharacterized damage-inducible protein DinB